jgi:type I restriction enzyme M protein
VEADGWSLDDKRQPLLEADKLGPSPKQDLTEEEHAKNNFPDVLTRWQQHNGSERGRPRTAQSFCVSKSEIAEKGYDLSVNRYKEVVYEEVVHVPPAELIPLSNGTAEAVPFPRKLACRSGTCFVGRKGS